MAPNPQHGWHPAPTGSRPEGTLSWLVPFLLMHLISLGVVFTRASWRLALLCAALYGMRMFAITAGYHRYFSHRTFRLNRFNQFLLAWMAQTSVQKGVLWWAAHHRDHHRYSDTPRDSHSPVIRGLAWAHLGWVLSGAYDGTNLDGIKDFACFPELRFLNRHHWLPPASLALALFLIGGWPWLLWGFFLSTILLAHATFCINSLAHVWGSRPFQTRDQSRNNFLLALMTFGEGWHNNHHHCPGACRQGIRWWQPDLTFYLLTVLGWLGLVRDIRPLP